MDTKDPRSDTRFRHFDQFDSDDWIAPVEDLRSLTTKDLLEFKRLTDLDRSRELRLRYADVDPEYLDADETPSGPSEFGISPRRVLFRVTCIIDDADYHDDGVAPWIEKVGRQIGARYGIRLIVSESQLAGGAAFAVLTFALYRGAKLDQILELPDQLQLLLDHNPSTLDSQSAWVLLRAGQPQGLIGCPESHWLEAKREPYDLRDSLSRLELAKDVSALANSGGGVLAIGLTTSAVEGVDTVSRVSSIPRSLLSPERYRAALRTMIYPRLQGLELVFSPVANGRGVLGVHVPRQPTTSLPFIVVGMPGVRRRRIEGAYWGVFRREGEDAIPITAAAIHTAIRGGIL